MAHGAVASHELGDEVVAEVFETGDSEALRSEVRHALRLVRALTLDPESVRGEHIAPMRELGVDDDSIRSVIAICALFAIINRIADSLEFHVPPEAAHKRAAPMIYRMGYKVP